jgi:hypothetical protein
MKRSTPTVFLCDPPLNVFDSRIVVDMVTALDPERTAILLVRWRVASLMEGYLATPPRSFFDSQPHARVKTVRRYR